MESRIIKLPAGGELEVTLTPKFLEIIKSHFDLEDVSSVGDDHIRHFIYASTKSAIDKEEE
jgi:hypothetical protein